MRITPLKQVGEKIQTAFLRGVVLEVADGLKRNWDAGYYYLVEPVLRNGVKCRPHWVAEHEVVTVALASSRR